MIKNLKQRKQEGFTIIEVLIVLAIAGLILLVVFLAVPALQRNARNTQAKTEAGNILSAVSEFSANQNSGKAPANGSSATSTTDAAKILSLVKLQNIDTLIVESTATTQPTTTTAVVRAKSKCTNPTDATSANNTVNTGGGAARQVALLYIIEGSGGNLYACQDS